MIRLSDRAFCVRWRELERWSVGYFARPQWHWSPTSLRSLGSVLKRKTVLVDRTAHPLASLRLVTLRFDGSMELRAMGTKEEFKGALFFADPGDLLFSKIDVRNGALGIVPESLGRVAVSNEYPVYEVDEAQVDPAYLALVLRSETLRGMLNAMISGASGRKRVTPEDLETLDIPLPALETQAAIVAHWRDAQTQAATLNAAADAHQSASLQKVMSELKIPVKAVSPQGSMPRMLVVQWSDLERWGFRYNALRAMSQDLEAGRYATATVGEVLDWMQYGTSEKANTEGQGYPVVRMNNVQDGQLDLTDIKHVPLTDSKATRLLLEDGDVLINRTNSRELVGKCAVVYGARHHVFASYLIRLRVNAARCDPEHLVWCLNGPIGRQQIDALSRQIGGQANINSEEIRGLLIPLPPLDTQRQIVAQLRADRNTAQANRQAATHTLTRAKAEVEAMILGTHPPSLTPGPV